MDSEMEPMEVETGYMLKRGQLNIAWKNRFFKALRTKDVIEVKYYKTASDKESLGSFEVKMDTHVEEFNKDDKAEFDKKFGFKVLVSGDAKRTRLLSPPNEGEMQKWLNVFKKFSKPPQEFLEAEHQRERCKQHYVSFARGDPVALSLDFSYEEKSTFVAYDVVNDNLLYGEGLLDSKNCMETFYEQILPKSYCERGDVQVYEQCFNIKESPGEAVWYCPSAGIDVAISKVVMSKKTDKVLHHYICVIRNEEALKDGTAKGLTQPGRPSQSRGKSIRSSLKVLERKQRSSVLSSYTEGAAMSVFNKTRGKLSRYEGERIQKCFDSMYKHLDSEDNQVVEKRIVSCPAPYNCVFFWWSCENAGFKSVLELHHTTDGGQVQSHQTVLETVDVEEIKRKQEYERRIAAERAEQERIEREEEAQRAAAAAEREKAAAQAAAEAEAQRLQDIARQEAEIASKPRARRGGLFRPLRKLVARGTGMHGAFSGKKGASGEEDPPADPPRGDA